MKKALSKDSAFLIGDLIWFCRDRRPRLSENNQFFKISIDYKTDSRGRLSLQRVV